MTVPELEEFGMHRMDESDITQTLSNQSVGVLAVPTEGAPSMRPLSYWFDGEDALYFVYVLGDESRKQQLSDSADIARFLVYNVETTFNWRSVLLTGGIEAVPDADRTQIQGQMETSWRPELFERAATTETTAIYRFDIDDWAGIEQLELPPELREPSSEGRME